MSLCLLLCHHTQLILRVLHYITESENRLDYLVYNLIELLLLDAAQTAQDARINSNSQNLALHVTLLLHLKREHLVFEFIGVMLAIIKNLRRNQGNINEAFVELKFVV